MKPIPLPVAWLAALLLALPLLAGCAAAPAARPLLARVLSALGLALPAEPAPVAIELHAAPTLNAARDGVAVPTRVQLHWLRDVGAFLRTPYARFEADAGAAAEYVLVPGARLVLAEAAPADARSLGVVVLFRAPAPGRWRYAFELDAPGPIRLSLHQCAAAVAAGRAVGAGTDAATVGDARCPPAP